MKKKSHFKDLRVKLVVKNKSVACAIYQNIKFIIFYLINELIL